MQQVIKKRRIVLASVLKPVDDTRMFEKLGVSLADEGFEVFIVGFPSSKQPIDPSITFYQHTNFRRFSFKRFFIPWLIFIQIQRIKPDVVIINTPELLFIAMLSRVFFGRQIIYDVLENYYFTIRYTHAYPSIIRWIVASAVRGLELLSSPGVTQFLLAEKGYVQELGFVKRPTVLENKLPKAIAAQYAQHHTRGYTKLIFSGTLAPTTGIFEAIDLCKGLHRVDPAFTLTIIGYSALPEILADIKSNIQDTPFIKLIGGHSLVPHGDVLSEIKEADLGIIIYPSNPSTQSSVPTKLYEYLALNLPILIRHNQESHELVKECQAGIILSESIDYYNLAATLKKTRFSPIVQDSIFWEAEAQKLIASLKIG